MIKYNIKYRAPFEYDKLVLMIFQYVNEIKYLKEKIKNDNAAALIDDTKTLDGIYSTLTEKDGIMNQLYLLNLKMEKGTI